MPCLSPRLTSRLVDITNTNAVSFHIPRSNTNEPVTLHPESSTLTKMPSASFNGRRVGSSHGHISAKAVQLQTFDDNDDDDEYSPPNPSHRKVVNIGDILDDRYRVIHKIKQCSKSVSYLCRDLEEDKWRRVTVARSHQFMTAMDEFEKGAEARKRLGEKEAERQGFCLKVFSIAGPAGVYMSLVYPLASHECDLRFAAPYDEAYFLDQLRRWEEME